MIRRKLRMTKTCRFFYYLLMILIIMMLLQSSIVFAEKNVGKRILFISSYSPAFPTFFLQIDGLKEELDNGRNVMDIEFMDTKRFPAEENRNRFYNSIQFKLADLPPYDIVIVSDDDGLNFVMKNKQELFPDTPIVFMGINNLENAEKYSQDPLVSGVIEAASIGDTIRLANRLNSSAKRVVALTDSTSSGQGDLITYYQHQKEFENLVFTDLDLSDMSYDEFAAELETLTDADIVLALSSYVDNQGTVMTFQESLDLILEHLKQPLYHPYYHGIGNGMLGGRVISHYEQGRQAGMIAERVLAGEDISKIPVVLESPNPYLIDYKVLEKYHLNEKLLPEGTQFINRDVSIVERYFWVLLAVLIGLILQALIIFNLVRNIRKRKLAEKEIYDMLYLDHLTGMNNRLGITEILDARLKESPEKWPFYILFLDIDNFKNINDTFGHDLGDQVICETGRRLKRLESKCFQVGRFGGDEFLILLNTEDNVIFEEIIVQIQECLRDLIVINENQFYLTTSIGVAEYPRHGMTIKELIKRADMALYEAKNSGKNKYVMFQNSMSTSVEEKVRFQSLLKEAFLKKEFYLNFQPYICPDTERIIGFEALIRWNSPEMGQVSPYKLVTNAEEIGLIIEIGNWVIEEACKFVKKVNTISGSKIEVSVNISMVQLMYKNFFNDVISAVQRAGVSPELICLEMTETIMIESLEMGQELIRELKDYGFSVALDDFGTGYSSLGYLRTLPANTIKIDKSFIDGVENDPYNRYTLETIVNLAHQLGFCIIAEGVEKRAQLEYLRQYHCDAIQGYLFSKPLSEADALNYLINRA